MDVRAWLIWLYSSLSFSMKKLRNLWKMHFLVRWHAIASFSNAITYRSQWHQGQHCCSSLYNLKWSQIWYWWCYPHQWASTTWSSQRYLNRRSCVEAQSPLSNLCVTEHCDALVRPYGTNREKLRANAKENILQCMYCTRVTFLWLWQTLVVRASFVAVLLVVLLDVLFVIGCVAGNTAQQQ